MASSPSRLCPRPGSGSRASWPLPWRRSRSRAGGAGRGTARAFALRWRSRGSRSCAGPQHSSRRGARWPARRTSGRARSPCIRARCRCSSRDACSTPWPPTPPIPRSSSRWTRSRSAPRVGRATRRRSSASATTVPCPRGPRRASRFDSRDGSVRRRTRETPEARRPGAGRSAPASPARSTRIPPRWSSSPTRTGAPFPGAAF